MACTIRERRFVWVAVTEHRLICMLEGGGQCVRPRWHPWHMARERLVRRVDRAALVYAQVGVTPLTIRISSAYASHGMPPINCN